MQSIVCGGTQMNPQISNRKLTELLLCLQLGFSLGDPLHERIIPPEHSFTICANDGEVVGELGRKDLGRETRC